MSNEKMFSNYNNVNTCPSNGNTIENNAANTSSGNSMINPNSFSSNVQRTGFITVTYFSGGLPFDSNTIDIYIDNQFVGSLCSGDQPFSLPLTEGSHVFSVKSGVFKYYRNDPPYNFNIYSGQNVQLQVLNNYSYGLAVATSLCPWMLFSRDCRRNVFGAFMEVRQIS